MSNETKPPVDLSALTIDQLEQSLFRDSAIEVTDSDSQPDDPELAIQALLQAEAAAAEAPAEEQQAEAPEAQAQQVQETPNANPASEEPAPVDPAQQYMQQNQQILQYLAEQQQAEQTRRQQQEEEERAQAHQYANSDEAINDAIAQAGLNPSDPMHQFAYRQAMESNNLEQRLIEMERRVQQAERQAVISKSQMELSPRIEETLSAYGSIPKNTLDTIKSNAAQAMAHGYEQQASIDMAIAPYLDLLRHMKEVTPAAPAPVSTQTPPTKTRDNASLLAASLTGRSTGHAKTIENLSIDDIEKALFR